MSVISLLCTLIFGAAALVSANEGKNCSTLNVLLSELSKKSVRLLPTVTKIANETDHACKSEWSEHGTCCDFEELRNHWEREKNETNMLNSTLRDLISRLQKIILTYDSLAAYISAKGLSRLNSFPHVALEHYILRMLGPHGPHYQMKKMLVESYLGLIYSSQTQPNTNKCLEVLTNLRANSLCSICSGRSSEAFFFTPKLANPADQKAKLGSPQCLFVLDTCGFYFTNIMGFTHSLWQYSFYIKASGLDLFLTEDEKKLYDGFNLMAQYMTQNSMANLFSFINMYRQLPHGQAMKTLIAKQLCNTVLRVVKDIFLKGYVEQIEKITSYLQLTQDRITSVTHQWVSNMPNYAQSKFSRLLQSASQLRDMNEFPSDVLFIDAGVAPNPANPANPTTPAPPNSTMILLDLNTNIFANVSKPKNTTNSSSSEKI